MRDASSAVLTEKKKHGPLIGPRGRADFFWLLFKAALANWLLMLRFRECDSSAGMIHGVKRSVTSHFNTSTKRSGLDLLIILKGKRLRLISDCGNVQAPARRAPGNAYRCLTDATEQLPTYTSIRGLHHTHKLSACIGFVPRLETHTHLNNYSRPPGAPSRLSRQNPVKLERGVMGRVLECYKHMERGKKNHHLRRQR